MQTKLKNNKIIIEFNIDEIDESVISFLSSMAIAKKSQATEEDIYNLSEEVTENWWKKNKKKFIYDKDSN